MIPYGRQHIEQEEIDEVIATLTSDYLTQGPRVPQFEEAIIETTGAGYAVAANSATSSLHSACLALDLGEGKALWTSPNSFVASSNVGLLCGASVDFVDINPQTFNMCIDALAVKLGEAAKTGTLPHIVMPVHFGGEPCDMAAIRELSRQYGFYVIEDASHAIGGRYRNTNIGDCTYSDITVFSFHPVKIITTAEGGCATTNSADLADKLALYRSHGVTRDERFMAWESDGPWYYQQVELGLNYRMTELQAALGTVQMKRLNGFLERRHAIADRYRDAFQQLPLRSQECHPDCYSALHLYVIRLNDSFAKNDRARLFGLMRHAGIGVNVLYIPIHTQPFYKALGFSANHCPEAIEYYNRTLALPMYPDLSEEQQTTVINILHDSLDQL